MLIAMMIIYFIIIFIIILDRWHCQQTGCSKPINGESAEHDFKATSKEEDGSPPQKRARDEIL
jgi:hypothetical protein